MPGKHKQETPKESLLLQWNYLAGLDTGSFTAPLTSEALEGSPNVILVNFFLFSPLIELDR